MLHINTQTMPFAGKSTIKRVAEAMLQIIVQLVCIKLENIS